MPSIALLTPSYVELGKRVLHAVLMDTGQRIKSRRESVGMTQDQLAAEFGISREAVANWERGANLPRGKRLSRLAELLVCDVAYLLGKQEEPKMRSRDAGFVEKMLSLPPNVRRAVEAFADSLQNESRSRDPRQGGRNASKKGR